MYRTRQILMAWLFVQCVHARSQGPSETLVSARFAGPLSELQSKLIYEQCRGLDPQCSVVLVVAPGELELRSLAGIPPEVFLDALLSVQELTIATWDDHVRRPFRPAMNTGPQVPPPLPGGTAGDVQREEEHR